MPKRVKPETPEHPETPDTPETPPEMGDTPSMPATATPQLTRRHATPPATHDRRRPNTQARKTRARAVELIPLPYDKELARLTLDERRRLTSAERRLYEDRAGWGRVADFLRRCWYAAGRPRYEDISATIAAWGYSLSPALITDYHSRQKMAVGMSTDNRRLEAILAYYGKDFADVDRALTDVPMPERVVYSELAGDVAALFRLLCDERPAVAEALAAQMGYAAYQAGLPIPGRIGRLLPPRPAVAVPPLSAGVTDAGDSLDDSGDELALGELRAVSAERHIVQARRHRRMTATHAESDTALDADEAKAIREAQERAREIEREQQHRLREQFGHND